MERLNLTQEEIKYVQDHVLAHPLPIVYKFMSSDVALKVLESSCLRFKSPLLFNDPFDCQLTVDGTGSLQDLNKQFNHSLSQKPRAERRRIGKNAVKDQKRLQATVNETLRASAARWALSCFSQSWDPILMWSHYADQHKGVVMGFDPGSDPLFRLLLKVKYLPSYPKQKFWGRGMDLLWNVLTTKYELWKYEEEVRAMAENAGDHAFQSASLKDLTFGCATELPDMARVVMACKNNGWDKVHLFKAAKVPFEFKLTRLPIDQTAVALQILRDRNLGRPG